MQVTELINRQIAAYHKRDATAFAECYAAGCQIADGDIDHVQLLLP